MTDDQSNNEISQDLESIIADDELLDILRTEPEFSIEQYGDLDIVLEKLKNGLAEFVSGFISDEVFFELSNVAIYAGEEQFAELGTTASFVNFHNKRGELILCVGLGSTSFRRILRNLLGGFNEGSSGRSVRALTSAENKLFERFSKHLCQAFTKILKLKSGELDAVETDFKLLNKLTKELELVVLTYQVSFSDAKFMLSVLTTLDQLEPKHVGHLDGGSDTKNESPSRRWSQKLALKIDELEVPLFVQLAEKTMNLVDVAKFENGMRMDIEFGLNDLCVTDSEENNLFAADLEIHESEVVFSVTSSRMNS